MPCNDCSRAEGCPPCVEEPKAPDRHDICACGHYRKDHTSSRCCSCDALFTDGFMHSFELPEPEATEGEVDQMMAEGEPVQLVSPNDRCTCEHKRKRHNAFWCNKCRAKGAPIHIQAHRFERETIEDWPCGDCGATVPGNLDWCQNCDDPAAAEEPAQHECPPGRPYFCPTSGEEESGCHGGFDACCASPELHRPIAAPQVPRRPPYAVAYAIQDGHVYELALPGDASVIAEDGVLKISHPGAVLALVQARPMEVPDAVDAEEQDPGPLRVE